MRRIKEFCKGYFGVVALVFMAISVFIGRAAFSDMPDVDWPVDRAPAESALTEKAKTLKALIGDIESRGLDASYSRSSLVMAEDAIKYAREDEANGRPGRASYTRGYLDGALDSAISEARALLKDPALNRPVPHPPLRDIVIRNGAFYSGDVEVMFGGMGHFGQVRRDIPKFPDYGFNLIQIEIGPNSVITGPGEDDVRTDAITGDILKQFDVAAENNIMINLLLSPHYFPQWAMDMYPELKQCGKGFIQYCVSDPNARRVLERFLKILIPMVKDKPALQSYTLANEPQFYEHSDAVMERFREHLKKKYGSIEALNRAWHKKYKDFSKITIANELLSLTACARLDWTEFHDSIGTEFFAWMKSVIRTMDPKTPVHIKFMDSMFENDDSLWGIDREALEYVTDISGNDSTIRFPDEPDSPYAMRYRQNAAFYDFLKSVQPEKPIQNSETHIIADDVPRFYPENYIKAALWIQYLHGLAAHTMWVWERSDSVSLGNNILSRANCIAATGRATLDVRRLAPYVTALANAGSSPAPPLALYYSQSSRAIQFDFLAKWDAAYGIAAYLGRPVKIITDRMLERGLDAKRVPLLIIPEYIYTTDALYKKLIEYVNGGGNVISLGLVFGMNEQDRKRNTGEWNSIACGSGVKTGAGCVETTVSPSISKPDELFRAVHGLVYSRFGLTRPELIITGADQQPVLGVEYRSAKYGDKRVAYILNPLNRAVTINLKDKTGAPVGSRDLITGRAIASTFTMQSLDIVMFEF